jgi:hypothetical protein
MELFKTSPPRTGGQHGPAKITERERQSGPITIDDPDMPLFTRAA